MYEHVYKFIKWIEKWNNNFLLEKKKKKKTPDIKKTFYDNNIFL